jgi:hypothetical protein
MDNPIGSLRTPAQAVPVFEGAPLHGGAGDDQGPGGGFRAGKAQHLMPRVE